MQIDTNGITLGDIAQDRITGYRGIVVGIAQHLTGCARAGLQAQIDKEGKVPEAQWFDVTTLERIGPSAVSRVATSNGGPQVAPRRAADPR